MQRIAKSTIIKWGLITALILAVVTSAGYAGIKWYKRSKETRLLAQAKAFRAKGDMKSASLALRQLMTVAPNNLEGAKIIAEMTDDMGAANSVSWRRKVAELEPNELQNHILWARSAMRQKQFAVANEALSGVPPVRRDKPIFYHVASGVALGLGQITVAESNAQQAVKLDPGNELYQLDLAAIQLHSTNAAVHAQARAAIEKVARNEKLSCHALETLVADAVRCKEPDRALALSTELQSKPCVQFSDRLVHLTLLTNKPAEVEAFLAKVIPEAEKKAGHIFELASWMGQNHRSEAALQWLTRLSPDLKALQPVRAALADAYAARKDWPAVEKTLSGQDWREIDFVRLAMLARASREQGDKRTAIATWNQAVNKAADAPEKLMLLYRSSNTWGWDQEADGILWGLSERPGYFDWAMRTLYVRAQQRQDTHQLHRVAGRILKSYPNDEIMKNNFAVYSLLLDLQTERALAYARELYQKYPTSPIISSTLAFALHRNGQKNRALEIMRSLPAEALGDVSIGAYYGLILAETGSPAEAAPYLKAAADSPKLLPEERALIAKAAEKVAKN